MAYLFVLISLVDSFSSSLFLWGRESLVLSKYYKSSLTMCNYLEVLPVYSMKEVFISQLSFGRVYGRYLVPSLAYLQLTVQRLMVILRNKTEL